MGRIVAIGGGDLNTTKEINNFMVKLSKKKCPNLLFIGTASEDSDGYFSNIKQAFQNFQCEVKSLCITKGQLSEEEIDNFLNWADIIYVGGGNTAMMMKKWKETGVDKKLVEIYKKDKAVLGGLSAGAMCWFNCGHSNSKSSEGEQKYFLLDGLLDIHHFVFCPHYNDNGRETFDEMLCGKDLVGLALESETAFVEQNGEITFIRSREEAKVYRIEYQKNIMNKTEIKTEYLV